MNTTYQLERDLWDAADQLWAGAPLTASEYAWPILSLIFLRQASLRFELLQRDFEAQIEQDTPGLKDQAPAMFEHLLKLSYQGQAAIYLEPQVRFETIARLPADQLVGALNAAMQSIEAAYPTLEGVLTKFKYDIIPPNTLAALVAIFNRPALKTATGDVIGRVYEYFLNEFARLDAQGGGAFFTPPALVRTIVGVIEPQRGRVLDPACGSAGMFVQTAHFFKRHHPGQDINHAYTFYGQEKTLINTDLSKLNMTVHGLDACNIKTGNTFYDRMDALIGTCDFVMANPPFNMDGVDAARIAGDPRLPFGQPGTRGKSAGKDSTGAVSNANSLWLQYFYAYLNDTGRAGFVMAASASDAGGKDRDIRKQLIDTGHVDVMISIGPKFFYTVTLPCTLWFYDRGKAEDLLDQVLMIDARAIYTVVSARSHTFSDEQLANLLAIVQLYRGQDDRLRELLISYHHQAATHLAALPDLIAADNAHIASLESAIQSATQGTNPTATSLDIASHSAPLLTAAAAVHQAIAATAPDASAPDTFSAITAVQTQLSALLPTLAATRAALAARHKNALAWLDETEKTLSQTGAPAKTLKTLREAARPIRAALTAADPKRGEQPTHRDALMAALDGTAYFHAQAAWLIERFPHGYYEDVAGLCRIATREEIAANDYSLTPGRYVGVAAADAQHGDDFKTEMATLHDELATLNAQAAALAARIQKNWGEMVL